MKSALITGAGGFVGRALAAALHREGIEVLALTRRAGPLADGLDGTVVATLDRPSLERAAGGRTFDVLFHLAAYGVRPGDRDTETMFQTNIAGTQAVLEFAKNGGARAVVCTGSCAEYATPEHGSILDEDAPLMASSIYGASKAAAGLWALASAEAAGLPLVWLRPFGVFGPGEADHRLLPAVVRHLVRSERVPLSPGDQVRDMMFVDDAAAGILAAGDAALAGAHGVFNLCTGKPASIRHIAELAADALGKPRDLLDFGAIDYREGENMWLVGNPERFAGLTGFSADRSLYEGVAMTVRAIAESMQGETAIG